MATNVKPRGRPPADGNFIVWTQPLVESLLRLRFEKYPEQMAAARGTKSLRQAWADVARELTLLNNGDVVSVEQCRNKVKAMRNKWLAFKAGLAAEPVCLVLMDAYWGGGTKEEPTIKAPRESRSSPEHRKPAKKLRLTPTSTSVSDVEVKMDAKPLLLIAPASASASVPAPGETATALAAAEARLSGGNPAQLLDVGVQSLSQAFPDVASAAADAARPTSNPSVKTGALSNIEKLVSDRFTKVLENQKKQLRLTEAQNQLLTRLLATLQHDQHVLE